jgi:hypothetical protein
VERVARRCGVPSRVTDLIVETAVVTVDARHADGHPMGVTAGGVDHDRARRAVADVDTARPTD